MSLAVVWLTTMGAITPFGSRSCYRMTTCLDGPL